MHCCKLNSICLLIKLNIIVFVEEHYYYPVALRNYMILKHEYNIPIMDGLVEITEWSRDKQTKLRPGRFKLLMRS